MTKQEELTILNKLIIISEGLYNEIIKLASIEAKQPFDKEAYIKEFASYRLLEIKEEELLKQLDLNFNNGEKYVESLLGQKKQRPIDFIINNDEKDISKMHLANLIANISLKNIKINYSNMQTSVAFTKLLQNELSNIFIHEMEEEIERHPEEEKKELVLAKYKIDFLELRTNKPLEYFKGSNQLIIHESLIKKYGFGYQTHFRALVVQILTKLLMQINLIEDKDIEITKKYLDLIQKITLIKSLLLMSDEQIYQTFQTQLHHQKGENRLRVTALLFNRLDEVHEKRKELIIK